MKLYTAVGACSICSHIALEECGAHYDLEFTALGSAQSPILPFNPLRAAPALVLESGEVLTQSSVVLPYIADLDPEERLLPSVSCQERRQILQWLNFFTSDFHPALKMLAAPERFTADASGLSRSFSKILGDYFEVIDETLADSPWLTGDQFTLADIYCGAAHGWGRKFGLAIDRYHNYRRTAEAFEKRNSVRIARAAEAAAAATHGGSSAHCRDTFSSQ